MRDFYKNLKLLSICALLLGITLPGFAQSVAATTTFSYTGAFQTYSVPLGITQIVITAEGATGGLNSNEAVAPDRRGYGGCITDTLGVTPGETIYVVVGGKGGDGVTATAGGAGGYNGGGYGDYNHTASEFAGGGGGGASDIRVGGTTVGYRVIVAGGGGGAAIKCASPLDADVERGGDGGGTGLGSTTSNFAGETGPACTGNTGGGGGTYSTYGTGGYCALCPGEKGFRGDSVALGVGGSAGALFGGSATAGGGGGGGWHGGGGGDFTGGGGGSNYGSATSVNTRGCNSSGNGVITVTPVCSTPAITGRSAVCIGLQDTVADATAGGTWSSSDGGSVISINATTGVLTGVGVGSTTITYVVGPCYVVLPFTVNALPVNTTAGDTVCAGSAIAMTDVPGPGIWASSNTAVGSIGSTTGILTGIVYGTTIITYTYLATGCINTTTMLVDSLPSPITGTDSVCVGLTTTYSDATATGLGAWASGNTAIATIDPVLGIITGVSAGTSLISYTVPTGACMVTDVVIVHALPNPVTGADTVCVGSTLMLSDAGFGTWMSGSTAVGTIGSTSGILTGISAGSTIITYTLSTSCQMVDTIAVRPLPAAITGADSVCVGLTTTLSDITTGGSWSSSNPGQGSIDPVLGVVTGISNGTITITYTLPTGCIATTAFAVHALPAAITGADSVCSGLTTLLSDSPLPGTWSSSDVTTATVGSVSGIVTGVITGSTAGTATITYTVPTGCIMTTTMLVNPRALITGGNTVCRFSTLGLSDAVPGGLWTSGNTGIATVGSSSGVVTGVAGGTAIITYMLPITNCASYDTVTVDSFSYITGIPAVCQGQSSDLYDSVSSGIWSSSNTSVAIVGSSTGIVTGTITGTVAGTATISYMLATGCYATVTETVYPSTPIFGTNDICVGYNTVLQDTTSGGGWIDGDAFVTSMTLGFGEVTLTGLTIGTSIISYILPTGCTVYDTVLVSPLSPITGVPQVCQGSSISLNDATPGGSWSISSGIAMINSTSGAVTGVSAGTAEITYMLGTGCAAYVTLTVYASPTPIAGPDSVCVGAVDTLSDAISGGTWSATGTVTIGGLTGYLFGVSSGTGIVTYTMPGNCMVMDTVTVNPDPAPVTGNYTICLGYMTSLGETTTGGSWSSSNVGIGSVDNLGNVLGESLGTATVSYVLSTGCYATAAVTVNPLPAAIVAAQDTVCMGQNITVSDFTVGGSWTISNVAVGTVTNLGGVITGITEGTTILSYTIINTGCFVTADLVVDSLEPIAGPAAVCSLSTISLIDPVSGGTWSSSNSTMGSVDAFGNVTGVNVGSAIVSYVLPTGCYATKVITINPIPDVITGTDSACATTTVDLADGSSSGIWISGNTGIATVGSLTGAVLGVSAGTTLISYTYPATGCSNTLVFKVYDLAPIIGSDSLCLGSSELLTDAASGGTWSSTDMSVGSIGSTGFVLGASLGTAIISYTLATGCNATLTLTVDPLPGVLTSTVSVVCQNATITLTDGTGGGTWISGNTGVSTVGSLTGVVTGVAGGTSIITYKLQHTGCYITTTVQVNPIPAAITPVSICDGVDTMLSDATGGGTWSSSNTTVGSIGSTTGIFVGLTNGTTIITYKLTTTGCYNTMVLTVDPTPPITGTFNVCEGLVNTTLSESIGGGTWSISDVAVGSIGSLNGHVLGVWTGVTAGTATITYKFATGCISVASFTVNPNPVAVTFVNDTVCEGSSISLTDGTVGGTWISSDVSVGTVGSLSGIVTGISGGTARITYELPTGCLNTQTVVVDPITPIIGPFGVCVGSSIDLGDATAGGSWISSTVAVGSIGSLSGIVKGISEGTTVITYMMATGCSATAVVTVSPLPAGITGLNVVCVGATIQLNDGTVGGSWISGSVAVGTVGSASGIVTGISAGTDLITYKVTATGCYTTYTVTVNPDPGPITGGSQVCVGYSLLLADGAGGTWISSNTAVGSIGSVSGLFQGISQGTTIISYQYTSTGCYATEVMTVNSLPSGITGSTEVCVGATVHLSDGTGGGTWSSLNTGVATIGSSGVGAGNLTGVGAGTTIITYTLGSSCYVTYAVTVLPQPSGIITPIGDTAICPGGFVVLTASTGSSLTYQWYNGGSALAGATTSSYTDLVAGSFSVFITNTLTGCTITSAPMTVTVNPVVGATITATTLTTACASTGVSFIASPTGMSYQWELDGTPIIGATAATFTASVSGSYSAIVTNTVGCSAPTTSISATLLASLPDVLSFSGPLTFCAGGSVVMTGDAGATTYQWYNTLGAITGATTMTYTATLSGTYYLIETNSIGCASNSANAVVVVNPLPAALITYGTPTTFCPGGSVVLDAPVAGGDTYQWYDDGVAVTGAIGATYTAFTTGNYQVKVTNTGCSNESAATDVVVLTTPAIVPLTPLSFCWGGHSYLSAEIVGGAGPVTYQWFFTGTAIPGATTSTYTAGVAGEYSVQVDVVGNTCSVLSSTVTVTENPLPNPVVTYSVSVLHTQNFYVSYQWYKGGVMIVGANADTLIVTSNGTYRVGVTDVNGCQSISDNFVLTDWAPNPYLGVTNAGANDDIRIYPNPAQNVVHVEASINVRAVVTTIDGRTVLDVANAKDVNIADIADGLYVILFYNDSGEMVKALRLAKQTQ